jgi:hypothetical protein
MRSAGRRKLEMKGEFMGSNRIALVRHSPRSLRRDSGLSEVERLEKEERRIKRRQNRLSNQIRLNGYLTDERKVERKEVTSNFLGRLVDKDAPDIIFTRSCYEDPLTEAFSRHVEAKNLLSQSGFDPKLEHEKFIRAHLAKFFPVEVKTPTIKRKGGRTKGELGEEVERLVGEKKNYHVVLKATLSLTKSKGLSDSQHAKVHEKRVMAIFYRSYPKLLPPSPQKKKSANN